MILFDFIMNGLRMKHFELKAVVKYLQKYKTIKYIKRVQNSTLKIEFEDKNILYFDMTKGNSTIYKADTMVVNKSFNAPFDVILNKKLNNCHIIDLDLVNNDRILRFKLDIKSSYKQEILYLQFEFTGIYTNVILLNSNLVVLEAIRHISEQQSSRVVKVGHILEELTFSNFSPKEQEIEDIEEFLYDNYKQKEAKELNNQKKLKLNILKKEEKKLNKIIKSLPQSHLLEEEANKLSNQANLFLANIHKLKSFQKEIELFDFENNLQTFDFSEVANVSSYINTLFAKSKKLKQKAKNLYLEKENLEQKLLFTQKMINLINSATSLDEIEFYMPKKEKNQSKTKKEQTFAEFEIDGYKIYLGRNERENIALLQKARANDFWFHLKDSPSSHVIVPTQKKELPQNVIKQAALLCAKFSSPYGGDYEVDYTKRRELKIQSKANLLYNNYKTIKVRVD